MASYTIESDGVITPNKKRTFGLKYLIGQGLGGTLGGPIFVILGSLILNAKGGSLISLLLSGFLMLGFVLIYSELALSLPMQGGSYSFSKEAIGGFQGFLIGWMIWIGNLLFVALSGLGFALSLEVFLPNLTINGETIVNIIAVVIIIFYILYALKNPISLGKIMKYSTYAILIGFLVYIFLGLFVGSQVNDDFSGEILSEPFNLGSVISTTAFSFVIFCVYEWNSTFESLTADFDKIERPRKNIPRTFIFSIIIAIIIYWLVSLVTLLNLGNSGSDAWQIIQNSDAPLADTFGLVLNSNFGRYFMGFIGLIATTTSIVAGLKMSTHILYSMARDGYIHKAVKKEKNGIHWVALTISGSLIIILTLTMNINIISQASNFIFLFSMIFLSLSVIILRKSRPKLIRPWKVPLYPYVPIIGMIFSTILIISMPWGDYGRGDQNWGLLGIFTGLIIIVFGFVYYLFQIARRDHLNLMLTGCKIGMSLVILVFLLLFDIKILSNGSPNWNFTLILIIGAFLTLLTLYFDAFPVRHLVLKIMKQKGGSIVVAGLIQHSEKGSLISRIINYILAIFLFFIGICFIIISSVIALDIMGVQSSSFIGESNHLIKMVMICIFAVAGVIDLLNGLFIILQERDLHNLTSSKNTSKTDSNSEEKSQ